MKITAISFLSIAALTLLVSACGNTVNTPANNSTAANTANKSNTATVVNSNQATKNAATPVSNTAANANKTAAAAKFDSEKIQGKLQKGNTESVILYFGEESGDYAGYCFMNDSEAGRAILAACKDGEQCEADAEVDGEASCKVPGLEADLSASGRILRIKSTKSLGRRK